MNNKILYYLLLFFLPSICLAQEITGVWKGELYVDSTKKYYPFELTISEDNGKFTGYSRITFEENGVHQVVFRDHKIKVSDQEIVVEDDNQLAKPSSISTPKEVKKIMILTFIKADSMSQLNGTWSTNKTKRYLAATGSVKMEKKNDFKSTEIFKKLDELALTKKLSFNKEPGPKKEEIAVMLAHITLTDIATKSLTAKKIATPAQIVKPNTSSRPKDIPFAIIKKEPPVQEATPVVAAVIKKPAPPIAKPVSKPVVPAVAKNDKPAIPQPPAVAIARPVVPVAKPVEKRNTILPDQKGAATDVSKRSTSNIQELFFKKDSLQLTLYDNGEIDGDTVSILLNGKVIIAKKGLDTKPNSFTIYFDKDTPDSQMLVMYAENLGAIPPNTGLLVVREGASVYEVRFSADLKTNAALVLRRKKDE